MEFWSNAEWLMAGFGIGIGFCAIAIKVVEKIVCRKKKRG